MRPKRLTTESPLAESSPADQRTEGSYQRMVRHDHMNYLVWERHSITPTRGIYMLLRGRQIVYIGQSVNIEQRVVQHQNEKRITFDAVLKCYVPGDMDRVEKELIHCHQPIYNTIYSDSDPCSMRRRVVPNE